jgi:superfamily II DNA or RNA helicase
MSVLFRHINETFIAVECDRGLLAEIRENFTFRPPGFQFSPKFKAGFWDGKINLIDGNGKFYKGLLLRVTKFLEERDIEYDIDDKIFEKMDDVELNDEQVKQLYVALKGPFVPHDSQVKGVKHAINSTRSIILAPTSNGKSYAIHAITSYHVLRKRKVLIMVDRTNLVNQLKRDLQDEYGGKFRYETVYDYPNPPKDVNVFFTTWQSVYERPAAFFKNFDVIIADEVHKFKADSIKQIFDKCGHIAFRTGFTATLDNDSVCDRSVLIGLFGEPLRVSTNKEQIEAGIAARPIITMIRIKYKDPKHGREVRNTDFDGEVKYIEKIPERNQFIADLTSKLKGVTLIAFKHHLHGVAMKELIDQNHDRTYFADSTVSIKKREKIIASLKEDTDAVGVVSTGTFSTGLNIPNLNNLLITCQLKSEITVPQLIGRMIRRGGGKAYANIYDLGDDFSTDDRENHTFRHFKSRIEIYKREGFEVKVKNITL